MSQPVGHIIVLEPSVPVQPAFISELFQGGLVVKMEHLVMGTGNFSITLADF